MSEIYVITSGKGGVGKTTTTANLGMGLAMRGKKVVLVDTDTGLRNLDLLLGLENRIMYDLIDVTEGRVPYKKALVRHKKYENLFLLPTSQVKDMGRADKENIKLIVNRIRPQMVQSGDMLDMDDINDILSLECIGQVPDDEMVVTSTNRGEPCVALNSSQAGQAYRNIVGRILGEPIPFMTFQKEGILARLKRIFSL